MKVEELDEWLVKKENELSWNVDEEENLYIKHEKSGDEYKLTPKALKDLKLETLDKYIFLGRNVDHLTRITGYFSKVSGWNKGKAGELNDRYKHKGGI